MLLFFFALFLSYTFSRLVLLSCSTFISLALCVLFSSKCFSVSFSLFFFSSFYFSFCYCRFDWDGADAVYICYLFSDSFGFHFRIVDCHLYIYLLLNCIEHRAKNEQEQTQKKRKRLTHVRTHWNDRMMLSRTELDYMNTQREFILFLKQTIVAQFHAYASSLWHRNRERKKKTLCVCWIFRRSFFFSFFLTFLFSIFIHSKSLVECECHFWFFVVSQWFPLLRLLLAFCYIYLHFGRFIYISINSSVCNFMTNTKNKCSQLIHCRGVKMTTIGKTHRQLNSSLLLSSQFRII